MTQQSHYWAYTLRKSWLKKTCIPQCSLQCYLQQLGHGSNLDVHQQMNGWRSCGTHMQWTIQFSSVISDCLRPHESQHARPPCLSPSPGVHPNSCPSGWWCHPTISASVIPFSSCPQSLPAWGSFPMSQLLAWGGQSIGVSASTSVLPMNTQDWSPLGWV